MLVLLFFIPIYVRQTAPLFQTTPLFSVSNQVHQIPIYVGTAPLFSVNKTRYYGKYLYSTSLWEKKLYRHSTRYYGKNNCIQIKHVTMGNIYIPRHYGEKSCTDIAHVTMGKTIVSK